MDNTAQQAYLMTQVNTATPQKLQLMLIEAAIRLSRQAVMYWEQAKDEEAGEALIRCQEIFAEILGGLRPDRDPPLVRRVAGIYSFLMRSSSEAHLRKDRKAIEEVISVLEIERGTWQQVCEQLGSSVRCAPAPASQASFVG